MKATVTQAGLNKKLQKLEDIKDAIMPKAYEFFKKATPIRSGNARKQTRLTTDKTIQANYGYAGPLDQGSSKQAPQGMVKPTERHIAKLVDDYLKRSGA